jgi:hypothetical protein
MEKWMPAYGIIAARFALRRPRHVPLERAACSSLHDLPRKERENRVQPVKMRAAHVMNRPEYEILPSPEVEPKFLQAMDLFLGNDLHRLCTMPIEPLLRGLYKGLVTMIVAQPKFC